MTRIVLEEPNAKQELFLTATSRFIAYGGARGGGKSWAVRTKAILMALSYAGVRMLLLRRTYPELKENHVLPLMALLNDVAVYKETDKVFIFPNSSRLKLGYCDSESNVLQYQGQEYDVIFMDEATHFTEYQYSTLTACIRGANDFPKRMYLTCNPGGVGHAWVKRLFVDRQYRARERASDYTFISATVYDNKALLDKDPDYVNMLENLPSNLKDAWLYGRWDSFEGQYFNEFDRAVHVCEPFEIPSWWRLYSSMDYGLDMLANYLIAIDDKSNVYVFSEVYMSGLIVSDAIAMINEQSKGRQIDRRFAPPDLWNTQSSSGKSTAMLFYEQGITLERANNDRISGWLAVHELLKIRTSEEHPRLQIFKNCTNLIRTLPLLQSDLRRPNDCAIQPHEITHAPDALRYFANSYTYATDKPIEPKDKAWRWMIDDNDNSDDDFYVNLFGGFGI